MFTTSASAVDGLDLIREFDPHHINDAPEWASSHRRPSGIDYAPVFRSIEHEQMVLQFIRQALPEVFADYDSVAQILRGQLRLSELCDSNNVPFPMHIETGVYAPVETLAAMFDATSNGGDIFPPERAEQEWQLFQTSFLRQYTQSFSEVLHSIVTLRLNIPSEERDDVAITAQMCITEAYRKRCMQELRDFFKQRGIWTNRACDLHFINLQQHFFETQVQIIL